MRTSSIVLAALVLVVSVVACSTSSSGDCNDGQQSCSGKCVDLGTDPDNCGGCAMACHFEAPNCRAGRCTLESSSNASGGTTSGDPADTCTEGMTACSGICVTTSFDANNCGGCGRSCPLRSNGTRSCAGGICLH